MTLDLSTKPLGQDPLMLAAVYRSGLGKRWKSQSEAARALARLDVRREQINRALRLTEMPEAVISLFSSTEMVDATARRLIRLEDKIGRDEMARRASEIVPDGHTWQEIVALLQGAKAPARSKGRRNEDSPMQQASQYAEGLASGLWSTIQEAAVVTGLDRTGLTKAVAISKLPEPVLSLFRGRYLTLELGESLIGIQRSIGAEKMLRNARALHDRPKRRSTDELLNALAGAKDYSDMSLKIRATTTKITFEMTFAVEDAEQLLLDEDEVKGHIQAILMLAPQREKRKKR